MSFIEFMLIPVGLVVGLAFTRFLDGLWLVIDSPNRYWIHTLWIVNKVMQPILFLWSLSPIIASGGEGGLGFGVLLQWMATPTLMYLQALALVGLDRSDEAMHTRSWEDHFFAVRRRFFGLNVLLTLTTGYVAWVDVAGTRVSPAPFVALAGLSLLGFLSENRRLHGALAVVQLSLVIGAIALPLIASAR